MCIHLVLPKRQSNLQSSISADSTKAELAAIFHDYEKVRPISELKEVIMSEDMDSRLLKFNSELWHGPVAAHIVKKEAWIDDDEILNAIRYHTTGRANMSLLEKIIYLADYIEPGRHFPGVDEVRELAETDINKALLMAFRNTIQFLTDRHALIFPDTFEAYNDLIMKMGGNKY